MAPMCTQCALYLTIIAVKITNTCMYASQTDSSQKIHSHLNSHVESLGKLSNVRRRATPPNLGALKLKVMLKKFVTFIRFIRFDCKQNGHAKKIIKFKGIHKIQKNSQNSLQFMKYTKFKK